MEKPVIIVMELDVVVRHPLAEYLRECGCKVVEAERGRSARCTALGTFRSSYRQRVERRPINSNSQTGCGCITPYRSSAGWHD